MTVSKPPPASMMLDRTILLGTAAGLLYMTVSIAMIFINKQTMLLFPMPNVLLLLQMLCAIIVVKALKLTNVITFPPFCFTKAKLLLPVTLLYTANVGFGLMAVAALNVPVRGWCCTVALICH